MDRCACYESYNLHKGEGTLLHRTKHDRFKFPFWFPVKGLNINESYIMKWAPRLYIVFLPFCSRVNFVRMYVLINNDGTMLRASILNACRTVGPSKCPIFYESTFCILTVQSMLLKFPLSTLLSHPTYRLPRG